MAIELGLIEHLFFSSMDDNTLDALFGVRGFHSPLLFIDILFFGCFRYYTVLSKAKQATWNFHKKTNILFTNDGLVYLARCSFFLSFRTELYVAVCVCVRTATIYTHSSVQFDTYSSNFLYSCVCWSREFE